MPASGAPSFRHEALLYAGDDQFVEGAMPFVRGALEAEEPVLVAVGAAKIDLLRQALDGDAGVVLFTDMAELGRNPARIIPAWRGFLSRTMGEHRSARGIGEPIWSGRTPDEVVECHRHESLLNLAFGGGPAWWLLCPYDTAALSRDVIDGAHRSHPHILEGGRHAPSSTYREVDPAAPFDAPLSDPAGRPDVHAIEQGSLPAIRRFVAARAEVVGLDEERADDLVLAVNELATNSLRHGGGHGSLLVWNEDGDLVCEVRDEGSIIEPLVGRVPPPTNRDGGRGLWLVNQLCDLVQVRSFPTGAVVRLRMARRG